MVVATANLTPCLYLQSSILCREIITSSWDGIKWHGSEYGKVGYLDMSDVSNSMPNVWEKVAEG